VGLVGCAGEQAPEVTRYNLTVSSAEGGSVTTPGEGTFTYDEGKVINLVAKPDEDYRFVNWTGDIGEIADVEDATTTITMKDDYSVTATFAVKQYALVIHSTEGGSVNTPGENAYTYEKGEVVNLMAVADEGYVFINWTGGVSTVADVNTASTTITMNGGYSITANFAKGIWDWYDLDAVRDNLDGSYVLVNDLDSATAGYTELASATANGGKGWQPIGSLFADPLYFFIVDPVVPFTGSFDGQDCEIKDLFINRPDEDGVGLFSCAGGGDVIENLGLVNAQLIGRVYVGGLVGNNRGAVSNSYCTGSVTGNHHFVGGLAGGNDWGGTVTNSYSAGSVTGDGEYVGGLVGGNGGSVSNSYSTASVMGSSHSIGGLTGSNWGTVTNSYSIGSVTGNGNVGGLVGWNHVGTISNSYSTGSVSGQGSAGGLVGGHCDGIVRNSHYNYDEVSINGRHIITIGALRNQDFDLWLANDKFLDVDDRLSQEDGYYLINNVDDFKQLLAFGQDSSLKFRLTNDLDLRSDRNFYIPYLAGEFNGNDHKISNLDFYSDSTRQVGLFGYLASVGVVTGVSARNVDIFGNGIVGGLVAENDGTVSNSYVTGSVDGWWSVGGLVGWIGFNGGTVSNSYYNYDEVSINGRHIITIGALHNQDFDLWLANDKFLDVDDRLSQEDGYYLINNVDDFKQLPAFGQDSSLKFRLTNDLDLRSDRNFYVPYLAGEFDGNGHKILGLKLNFDCVAQVGLFGYLAPGGKVSQLGVENVNITVTGDQEAGGLVGGSAGTVSESYSTGSVTGTGNGGGGLVGWNKGIVNNSYSTGSVVCNGHVGSLVGWNYDGEATVSNSYSTGRVASTWRVGGLVGANGGRVSNSFWDTEISRQATSDGGTGKTTAEMKSIATFSAAGWNIIAVADPATRNPSYVWNIVDGQTYPFLRWEPV